MKTLLSRFREMDQSSEPKTLWNPFFIAVLVFGFMTGSANQMISPILSKYVVDMGATLSLAGTIVGLQSGMAMFLRPLSGAASDLLNRKYVMIGSILISSTAFTGYLLFNNIVAVIICRFLQGFSFAFMSVARTAFATEYMPRDRMGEGVAFTSFGVVLSQAVGPNIGMWVADEFGYRICFLSALCISILGAILLSMLPYKHKKGEFHRHKLKLNNLIAVEVLPYSVLAGLFAITTHLANSFLALVGEERGIENVALFFTMYSVVALAMRPASGKIVDKMGLSFVLYPAFFFAALTMILLGAAQTLTLILIAGVCKALSQGVALSSIQGSCIKRLGKERAGVASATIHLGQDLICTIAPAVGGFIASRSGYGVMYYCFAGIILTGMPLYMFLRSREKKSDRLRQEQN